MVERMTLNHVVVGSSPTVGDFVFRPCAIIKIIIYLFFSNGDINWLLGSEMEIIIFTFSNGRHNGILGSEINK